MGIKGGMGSTVGDAFMPPFLLGLLFLPAGRLEYRVKPIIPQSPAQAISAIIRSGSISGQRQGKMLFLRESFPGLLIFSLICLSIAIRSLIAEPAPGRIVAENTCR